jgi:hypothetical protein
VQFPTSWRPKENEVRDLIDREKQNVVFRDADFLTQRAREFLAPSHRTGFDSLQASDKALVNLVRTLRNHVAHRSAATTDAFRTAVLSPDLSPTFRRSRNAVTDIGAYLLACEDDTCRAHSLVTELCVLAEALALAQDITVVRARSSGNPADADS